jgi:hypothetical protein
VHVVIRANLEAKGASRAEVVIGAVLDQLDGDEARRGSEGPVDT